MSKLEELLEDYCPDGVEYKTIGEIATDIYRGNGVKRNEVTEDGIPCVRYGEIYTTYGIWFTECVSHTTLDYLKNPKYFEHGDILFAITGESVEDIAKSTAYVGNEKCIAGGDIVVLKHKQNPKYLSYVLSSTMARRQKSQGKIKSKVVHASVPSLKAITIPVPPLPVQEEIVRILDMFTGLTAELTAELTARKKQYEYYQDLLLNFSDLERIFIQQESQSVSKSNRIKFFQNTFGYAVCPLNEVILSLNTGLNPRRFFRLNTDDATNYYITIREILDGRIQPNEKTDRINDEALKLCNHRSNLEKGDVLFSGTGTIGEVAVVKEKPKNWNIKEGVYAIKPKSDVINSEFLAYILRTGPIRTAFMKKAAGGTVKSVPMGELRKLLIPIPPMEEQLRLVSILNQFHTLCSDISTGLPAEIEAREKQYEYYRDKLLTFKRKA